MSEAQEKTAVKAKKTKKIAAPKSSISQISQPDFPYAVIRTGGKQYKVASGDMLLVEKLEVEPGTKFVANDVLLIAKAPGSFVIGQPTVKGASVDFEVLQQTLGKKILIRHHRRRQNSQKTLGHRQPQTRLLVKAIQS